MKIIKVKNYKQLSALAAKLIAEKINEKPNFVLGLATGSTPIGTYEKLIEMNRKNVVDFSNVVTFNLDEYYGIDRKNLQSYYCFMMDKLFNHVNISKRNIHILDGMAKDYETECKKFENKIKQSGGIDLQLLGIGQNGHIGFNEPDIVFYNKTRQVKLTQSTIKANKRFFENENDVPKTALSMGIGTIMAAREIVLIAGADKVNMIEQLKKDIVTPQIPASILHYHPCCTIIYCEK